MVMKEYGPESGQSVIVCLMLRSPRNENNEIIGRWLTVWVRGPDPNPKLTLVTQKLEASGIWKLIHEDQHKSAHAWIHGDPNQFSAGKQPPPELEYHQAHSRELGTDASQKAHKHYLSLCPKTGRWDREFRAAEQALLPSSYTTAVHRRDWSKYLTTDE